MRQPATESIEMRSAEKPPLARYNRPRSLDSYARRQATSPTQHILLSAPSTTVVSADATRRSRSRSISGADVRTCIPFRGDKSRCDTTYIYCHLRDRHSSREFRVPSAISRTLTQFPEVFSFARVVSDPKRYYHSRWERLLKPRFRRRSQFHRIVRDDQLFFSS